MRKKGQDMCYSMSCIWQALVKHVSTPSSEVLPSGYNIPHLAVSVHYKELTKKWMAKIRNGGSEWLTDGQKSVGFTDMTSHSVFCNTLVLSIICYLEGVEGQCGVVTGDWHGAAEDQRSTVPHPLYTVILPSNVTVQQEVLRVQRNDWVWLHHNGGYGLYLKARFKAMAFMVFLNSGQIMLQYVLLKNQCIAIHFHIQYLEKLSWLIKTMPL